MFSENSKNCLLAVTRLLQNVKMKKIDKKLRPVVPKCYG
jgi:hypothetical protein